jgi:CheY-like chemotaxis protein
MEVVRQIRVIEQEFGTPNPVPVVLVTAQVSVDILEPAIEAGCLEV